MTKRVALLAVYAALALSPVAALAQPADPFGAQSGNELPPYLQCVPYAREVSGIQIFGDAWTWWGQAEGRYARGHTPRVGAVMAFQPYGNMTLGHVAAVSKVINSRTVLLRHANWSPIDGRRGQIENDVEAVDVSPDNDWSQVRVWYAPIQDLGSTAWPVAGFIYPDRDFPPRFQVASATIVPAAPPKPSRAFLSAFADLDGAPARVAAVTKTARGRPPVDLIAQIASR